MAVTRASVQVRSRSAGRNTQPRSDLRTRTIRKQRTRAERKRNTISFPSTKKDPEQHQLPAVGKAASPSDLSASNTTDKRSSSPQLVMRSRPITSPSFRLLHPEKKNYMESWLSQQAPPEVLLDPAKPCRKPIARVQTWTATALAGGRGRQTRRELRREESYRTTGSQWRSGIDNISPAPPKTPRGLTKLLGSSPEAQRGRPP
ncbi:hypothetical protein BT63DRAFT_426824 [Microthyrium microscopicum]|uniref:Uncharacterized protein n=1 Tax=Microthyrium microscopicum TaxID=703497 RepID=A0A6A6U957_9PEZI|nr:hypothetical protein BT63DRAFT_426824 [Microthyrium microscopicum]